MKISEFFDYAPKVFFQMRQFYGIDNDDYLKSIGPEQVIVFFYHHKIEGKFNNGKYIIIARTMQYREKW